MVTPGYNQRSRKIAKKRFPRTLKLPRGWLRLNSMSLEIISVCPSCSSRTSSSSSKESRNFEHHAGFNFTTTTTTTKSSYSDNEDFFKTVDFDSLPEAERESMLSRSLEFYNLQLRCAAEKAVEYYNGMMGTSFKLVESIGMGANTGMPRRYGHINFRAQSPEDASPKLFFAEVYVPYDTAKESEIEAIACCLLKKVNSGNPGKRMCVICGDGIIHPMPRYGYQSAGGDTYRYQNDYDVFVDMKRF